MIRVGDSIRPKKNLPPEVLEDLINSHNFPIKVESIHRCPTKESHSFDDCIGCPGYINITHMCFGRTGGYTVEPVETDWDE